MKKVQKVGIAHCSEQLKKAYDSVPISYDCAVNELEIPPCLIKPRRNLMNDWPLQEEGCLLLSELTEITSLALHMFSGWI